MQAPKAPPLNVFLVTDGSSGGSFGTAFIIHRDESAAYCLTCAHVVQSIGSNRIQVKGYKATVIAVGDKGQDPDLAVLRVEELKNEPCWELQTSRTKGISFLTEGFCKDDSDFYQRQLCGKLGTKIPVHLQGGSKVIQGWDLIIDKGRNLRPGNSGSPVWNRRNKRVLGVVSRRQLEGREGFAISIDALKEIWRDIPSGLIKPSPNNINPIIPIGITVIVSIPIILALAIPPSKKSCPPVPLQPTKEFGEPPHSGFSGNIRLEGSTSMDNITQALTQAFNKRYAGAKATYKSSGSEDGKNKLRENKASIAAVGESENDKELQDNNWKSFTIAPAPIAIIIAKTNPYSETKGLSTKNIKDLYTAYIKKNWSDFQPGRTDEIRIINRYKTSGTRGEFQSLALDGQSFGSAIEEWPVDETNKVIRQLGKNGIYYATCHQAEAQKRQVKILNIDGENPTSDKYPYKRPFRYIYKVDKDGKPSNNVAGFLAYVDSEEGRKIIQEALNGTKAEDIVKTLR
jgi:ABC-type phosphate transport system substrate-binding protein